MDMPDMPSEGIWRWERRVYPQKISSGQARTEDTPRLSQATPIGDAGRYGSAVPSVGAAMLKRRPRQHHVAALVAVHRLRDPEVAGERAEHVGLVARQVGAAADVGHHLAHGLLGRVVEVLVEADRDQVGRALGERPAPVQVLADGEPERAGKAGLDRGNADLAVALHRVAIP